MSDAEARMQAPIVPFEPPRPTRTGKTEVDGDELRGAFGRAQRAMLELQHPDGAWEGLNMAGPFMTAVTLVFERYLGAMTERDAHEGVRYLRRRQLPDGSVPLWPFATHGHITCWTDKVLRGSGATGIARGC